MKGRRLYVNKERLEAIVCQESFHEFVRRFWGCLVQEPLLWNWHLRFLCGELQTLGERVLRREPKKYDLLINIPPGMTKSTICSKMFPAWLWTHDPSLRVICGSYAFPLSLYLGSETRRLVLSEKYMRLFPHVKVVESQKGYLTTTAGGDRVATSTGGSITGMHGHVIIVDDPLNPKEAASDTMLATARAWFDETLMTRKVDRAITPTVVIMQRLHQDDISGHLLSKHREDLRHICLPAEVSDLVRPRRLRSMYRNGLLDEKRLSRKILEDARRDLGEYGYAAQFEQSPVPAGGGIFKVGALQVLAGPHKLVEVVRYWDKAGTSGGGAYTVGVKMGKDIDGRFVVLDVMRGQWEAAEREKIIRRIAEHDGREVTIGVEQEPGSGGKESAQATLRNLAGWKVLLDRPVGKKVARADPFAVQVNGGNVYLIRGDWNPEYLRELEYFPYSKYKDQVDASSGAFALLTQQRIRVGALK